MNNEIYDAMAGVFGKRLRITADHTMIGDMTIPARTELSFEEGATIETTGHTLTIGKLTASAVQTFTGTGKVIFAKDAVPAVLPQWWGARGDATIDGTSGTDCTTALAQAIAATCEDGVGDVSIHSLETGSGNFLTGAVRFPPACHMVGRGWHQTAFVAKPGTSGVWFGDAGNAAKIMLERFALYINPMANISHGLCLGYGAQQHGSEGYVRDVWVRGINGASVPRGIDINGNVGRYGSLVVYDCDSSVRIIGVANEVEDIVAYASAVIGVELNLCNARGIEIEAPGSGSLLLKISGNADIRGLVLSLANNTTFTNLIEISADATTWGISPLQLVFGSKPDSVIVTRGNILKCANGTCFGGNATGGNHDGEGYYNSRWD